MSNLNVKIMGSTKPEFVLSKEEALKDGAISAAICYLKGSFEDVQKENIKETKARIQRTLRDGHHSVYDHVSYNLVITGLPKILAMVLNNEKMYTTSEKSARYTEMDPTPIEKELYNKWLNIFESEIKRHYPEEKYSGMNNKKIKELAQENARYLTSVFTPTTMKYTTSFRQLNYLTHWFDNFIKTEQDTIFNEKLKKEMGAFNEQTKEFYVEELDPNIKLRSLTLFAKRDNLNEVFDEVYSVNYKSSFAYLAQAHRHRTLNYQMQSIEEIPADFFVPPILLDDNQKVIEWNEDMQNVAHLFPQGTLIGINERGLYEDFISKSAERLCGRAQLEISMRTKDTLTKYINATKENNPGVYDELIKYSKGPKCTFPGFNCLNPCPFGAKSLERLI